MEVHDTGLTKAARLVISEVDRFIDYYYKAKGRSPELIHLKPKDYESIEKSVAKSTKNKVEKMTRGGVLLCKHH